MLAAIWAIVTGVAQPWASVALPLPASHFLMNAAAILSLLPGTLVIVHPGAGVLTLTI
jgi:uncharacterized membrane protein HdeD (DUF308 family)